MPTINNCRIQFIPAICNDLEILKGQYFVMIDEPKIQCLSLPLPLSPFHSPYVMIFLTANADRRAMIFTLAE